MSNGERSYCLLSERAEQKLLTTGGGLLRIVCYRVIPGIFLAGLVAGPLLRKGYNRLWNSDKSRTLAAGIAGSIADFTAAKGTLPGISAAPLVMDLDVDSSAAAGVLTLIRDGSRAGFLTTSPIEEDGRENGGLFYEGGGIAVHDQWGHPFRIRLDTDGDGWLDNPSVPGNSCCRLRARALVWSAGKDGDPETWQDNITSW